MALARFDGAGLTGDLLPSTLEVHGRIMPDKVCDFLACLLFLLCEKK
jgi:hypothetical protein